MSNRKKRNRLDPMRIQNYNKFLNTLDNNQNNLNSNKETKLEEIKRILKTEEDIKREIDRIIDTIENNFKLSQMQSPNITGQTQNDTALYNIEDDNPNKYIDYYLNKTPTIQFYNVKHRPVTCFIPTPSQPPIIKEYINIEADINNITDILNLIDTYKIDPTIQYNIDMVALHSIKEP
jgi:hypothetical protein